MLHVSETTKVTAKLFRVRRIGECLDFLQGVTIDLDAMVRCGATACAYDNKMRVPLHRVWTAGVSSMERKPGHRNSHK
jgi:hypothetical protein